jgi:hypothetical protein
VTSLCLAPGVTHHRQLQDGLPSSAAGVHARGAAAGGGQGGAQALHLVLVLDSLGVREKAWKPRVRQEPPRM